MEKNEIRLNIYQNIHINIYMNIHMTSDRVTKATRLAWTWKFDENLKQGDCGVRGGGWGAAVQAAVQGGTGSRCSAREETAGRSRRPPRGDPGFELPVENGCPQQPDAWESRCR